MNKAGQIGEELSRVRKVGEDEARDEARDPAYHKGQLKK